MQLEATRITAHSRAHATQGAGPNAGATTHRHLPFRSSSGTGLVAVIVLLALLAGAALSIAAADGDQARITIEVSIQSLLAVAAAAFAVQKSRTSPSPVIFAPILLGLGLFTIPLELFLRLFDTGRAFEVILMDGLKFVSLGLAIVACWPPYRRLAVFMSLLVLLCAASLSNDVAVQTLVVVFAVVVVGWALAAYWEGLRPRFIATNHVGLPKRWLLASITLVLIVLATAVGGGRDAVRSLGGFMPSSGGDGSGWSDPYARDGVGDGDALVAGSENVQSFAPIEDAPFLADDKPSLYDVFDDTLNEPYPPKKQDRAVALQPDELIQRRCEQLAQTQKAGREFSTHRKGGRPKAHVADRDSPALLFVAGRTPLHLRMETFDLFDGVKWYPEMVREPTQPFRAVETHGRTWIQPSTITRGLDLFADEGESHAVKVVNLNTDRVPTPLHLTGVAIDKVRQPDFFEWAQGSIVRLDRESIPPLTVINVASRTIDRRRIEGEIRYLGNSGQNNTHLPSSIDQSQIASLAHDWTANLPRGWQQVEAITARLKSEYVHDPSAGSPEECRSPVEHFLFNSRRGRSDQFATAAAVLLRSLGYSTRLVNGFYANPRDYVHQLRHTPILDDDAHVWCEVYLSAGIWATVEPTPGYEVLDPPQGLWDHVQALAVAIYAYCVSHITFVSLLLACGVVLIVRWPDMTDMIATTYWRIRPYRNEKARVLATVRLLNRRLRQAGVVKDPGSTPRRRLQQRLQTSNASEHKDVLAFLAVTDWASFSPNDARAPDRIEWLCRRVVTSQSLRRLRRVFANRPDRIGKLIRRTRFSSSQQHPAFSTAAS